MRAFKSFTKGMTSRCGRSDQVYEIGKTYEEVLDKGGSEHGSGFYACEDARAILNWISLKDSPVLTVVELHGPISTTGIGGIYSMYTEAHASMMTIVRTITPEEILWESYKYRKAWCTGDSPTLKCSSERLVTRTRSPKNRAYAMEQHCVAIAQAPGSSAVCRSCGVASAEGEGCSAYTEDSEGIALALGEDCSAGGVQGAWVLLTDRNSYGKDESFIRTLAIHIDGNDYKPGILYKLERGEVKTFRKI